MGDNGSSSGGKTAGAWSSSDLHQVPMPTTLTHTPTYERTGATSPPEKVTYAICLQTPQHWKQRPRRRLNNWVSRRWRHQSWYGRRHRKHGVIDRDAVQEVSGEQKTYFSYMVWVIGNCMWGSAWTGSCKVECQARTARFTLYRWKAAWNMFKDPVRTAQ
jgi:hypothetical protein